MQATLDNFALKQLQRALTCLTRYGDELTIYATPDSFSLSTTNSSMSAYCCFKYQKSFFSKFVVGPVPGTGDEEIEEIFSAQGQLLTKSLLSILKHRTVEKTVERCELSICDYSTPAANDQDDESDTLESKLTVRLHCKHGVIKTHRLLLQNPESLLSPSLPPADVKVSHLAISAPAVKDILEPFSSGFGGDPLLVWNFGQDEVRVCSWDSGVNKGAADGGRITQMATELRISTQEFDRYEMCDDVCGISFHLKEFNATVSYADSMSLPLSLRFANLSGAPLFIEVEGEDVHGLFVISTSDLATQPQGLRRAGANEKKRAREGEPGPGGFGSPWGKSAASVKRPTKVVQRVDPGASSQARSSSRGLGSVPPASIAQNGSQWRRDPPTVAKSQSPFISQPYDAELLGMDDLEFADMLEVDTGAVPDSPDRRDNVAQAVQSDGEDEMGPTQTVQSRPKAFRPLFED